MWTGSKLFSSETWDAPSNERPLREIHQMSSVDSMNCEILWFKHLFSVRSKHSPVHGEDGQQKEKGSDDDLGLVSMMYMSGPTSWILRFE